MRPRFGPGPAGPALAWTYLAALLLAWASPARPQSVDAPKDVQSPPPAPVERSDDRRTKVTASVYLLPSDQNYDLNLRHKLGAIVAWIGNFVDAHGQGQARVGAEYDYQHGRLLVVPTLQVGSNGLVAGSLYGEWGSALYAIGGLSRTNLKPFYNLSFDPNESIQLGAGWHVTGYDRLYGFVIFDVRLHTSQQDSHVLWRHRLDARDGLTVDVLYKSGRRDDGRSVWPRASASTSTGRPGSPRPTTTRTPTSRPTGWSAWDSVVQVSAPGPSPNVAGLALPVLAFRLGVGRWPLLLIASALAREGLTRLRDRGTTAHAGPR